MAIEDTLAKVDLFSELDRDDLERLARVTMVRNTHKDEIIVREGETGVAFYIVAKGAFEVVKGLGTSNEQVIARLSPNAFFGEMALFDNQERSASVRATEDGQLLVLAKWDFTAELTRSDGRLALTMLSLLARRIRDMTDAATH
jgi:CRP-like cAMP-binding protein